MLVINRRLKIPLREFKFTFSRSQGPGGQNVNKVNTKATLRWPVQATSSLPDDVLQRFQQKYRRRISSEGDLIISSQRFRDQGRNVADCLAKLRDMVEQVAVPPRRRRPTKPTQASVQRRLHDKQKRSQTKRMRKKPKLDD